MNRLLLNGLLLALLVVVLYCAIYDCGDYLKHSGSPGSVMGLAIAASPSGKRKLLWDAPTNSGGTITYDIKVSRGSKIYASGTDLSEPKFELPDSILQGGFTVTIVAKNQKGSGPVYTVHDFVIDSIAKLNTPLKFDSMGNVPDRGSGYLSCGASGQAIYCPYINGASFTAMPSSKVKGDFVITATYKGKEYDPQTVNWLPAGTRNSGYGDRLLMANWAPSSAARGQPGKTPLPARFTLRPGDSWSLNIVITNKAGTFKYTKEYQVPYGAPGVSTNLRVTY